MMSSKEISWISLVILLGVLLLGGCASSPDPEDVVKNGSLEINPAVKIGEALGNYPYFGEKTWVHYRDAQERLIVEFKGIIDLYKFRGCERDGVLLTPEMVYRAARRMRDVNLTYIARFVVSEDGKKFSLKSSSINMDSLKKETGKKQFQKIFDEDYLILQNIYANQPEPSTWEMLYSAGG